MFRLKCIKSPRFGINTFINAMQTKTNSGNFANALLQYQFLKYLNTLATNSKCCASTVSIGAEATCFDFDPEASANHSKCFWRPIPFWKKKKKQQHRGCFPTWTQQRFRNAFHPASRTKDQTHAFPSPPSVRPLKLLGSFKRPKHSSIKGLTTEADAYLVTSTCFCVCAADLSTPGTKDWHQAAPRRAAVMTWPFILFGFPCCRGEVNLLAPALCGGAIDVSERAVEEK